MKSGLAGICEVVSVLNEDDRDFPGELLLTAYGQHETPWGTQAPLVHLLEEGIKGDAAIVEGALVHQCAPGQSACVQKKSQFGPRWTVAK